jgi:dTDP-glucose 4,6-dehydratase
MVREGLPNRGAEPNVMTPRAVRPLAEEDLEHVLVHTRPLWESVPTIRLFVSGGTGFFGIWLLESFLHAQRRLGLDATAAVLTRDPEGLARRAPHLAASPSLRFLRGDACSFEPPAGTFTHVVHAATETVTAALRSDPLELFERNVRGTRRVLDLAGRSGGQRFLLTSSGAVYGPQPPEIALLTEEYRGAPEPLDTATAYGQSKRVSEFLAAAAAHRHGFAAVAARCFAFVGPHLPLDSNYAVGNFIRDALRGGPVRIAGDGTPLRSYLYAADLAIWLWTLLFQGAPGRAYNVGSEQAISIRDLAGTVAEVLCPNARIEVAGQPDPARPPVRYVPSTRRAREELGLAERVSLREALRRTAAWHRHPACEPGP